MNPGESNLSVPEARLLCAAKQGDRGALDELVRRDQDEAWRQAIALCQHNEQDAWDVTMECYRRILGSLRKFKGASSFATWRYKILRNAFIDFLRRSKGTRSQERSLERADGEDDRAAHDLVAPGDDPAEELARADATLGKVARLRAAIAQLNPVYRVLLSLIHLRQPHPSGGSRFWKGNHYLVVLRYFRLLVVSPGLKKAVPYREGLSFAQVQELYRQICSRSAFDQKALHAREALVKAMQSVGGNT